jgi:hypothetical protein
VESLCNEGERFSKGLTVLILGELEPFERRGKLASSRDRFDPFPPLALTASRAAGAESSAALDGAHSPEQRDSQPRRQALAAWPGTRDLS